MQYVCEKAVGPQRSCTFRSGKIILQQPVDRIQMGKLLEHRKSDLLERFISRKGRPFKAFLAIKDGRVEFEFEPRTPKAGQAGSKRAAKGPAAKVDFTGQQPLGKCPKCGSPVFEGDGAYVCERAQAAAKPCRFKISKIILQQPVDRAQAVSLLSENKTSLLKDFVSSKTGKPFAAYLVMDDMGKVTFEFPPREGETAATKSR
jgi:DNA topoisomerase-3